MTTFLKYKDLKSRGITFSRVHVRFLVNRGRFPKPVRLGNKENSWIETEIEDWIAERIKARGSQYEPAVSASVHAEESLSAEATD